jgi:hypothetical protein
LLSTINSADCGCDLDPHRIDRTTGNVNELKGGRGIGSFAVSAVQFAILAFSGSRTPIAEGSTK